MAEKKSKKVVKTTQFKITKSNGDVLYRKKEFAGKVKIARYKKKGYKVEEI